MALLVTSVLIPLRNLMYTPAEPVKAPDVVTPTRRPTLVCRWVRDDRTGRPVARWVAEEDLSQEDIADSCEQIAAFLRSSDQAVA
jgi:hypothetical protein